MIASMTERNLLDIIQEYRKRYDSIGRVRCNILNADIYFMSEGKNHLIYKGNRKKRSIEEQRYKLRLFPLVIPVIKNSTEIKSWRFSNETTRSDIQHYALVAKVGKQSVDVRVIIKRTGDGQFNFHSVMLNNPKTKKPRKMRSS